MDDRLTPLRLLAAMLVLSVAILWMSMFFHGLPLIGELPGDFEIDLPMGTMYLPLATSVLLGLLLTLIAYALQTLSRK
ncbi:MAG: DUF2905 domain-containing protein [Bacteroidetes bacterium]|nr:DUF2905 domain-containing protein [Bacteroidota bacterium]